MTTAIMPSTSASLTCVVNIHNNELWASQCVKPLFCGSVPY